MSAKPTNKRMTSFFEFWPGWAMYFPVVVQWVVLSLRYRSLTLPFLANPSLHLSGMVGVPKSALMKQATGKAKDAILPWIKHTVISTDPQRQASACIARAAKNDINLPFACKPEIGCRGVGVKLVTTTQQLADIIKTYPIGADLLCQKLASYEPEVGIFYVKNPQSGICDIPSMTMKTLPRVCGDGVHTLGDLITKDPRSGQLKSLYYERHKDNWDHIPKHGETIRLVFSASHSKGAIFTDARMHITPALIHAIDQIMQGLPDFYYGRLDVKFKDLDALKKGETLQVVEINGASAEAAHIWDKDAKFLDAIKALLWQYRTLFRLGNYHRSQGKTPPSLADFWRGWRIEHHLTRHYPHTD